MSDSKTTYIVPDQNNNDWLAASMMNGGGFNNPFVYLIWAYMMRWMNGDNNNNLAETIATNHNTDLIMQGINGSTSAVRELANNLNCDFNTLQGGINSVSTAIGQLSAQTGFNAERIIASAERGDCNIIQALKDCCCQTQKLAIEQGYQNQLASERQTAAIQATSNANTSAIVARLDAMQNQALLDKLDALREKNATLQTQINIGNQTAQVNQLIQNAVNPIYANQQDFSTRLGRIECRLPETIAVNKNNGIYLDQCALASYGFGPFGPYNGLWG